MSTHEEAQDDGRGLETRWVELAFALLMLAAGSIVIFDSVRIGHQWASDGPQSGYFPWLTGCALALAGGWLAATTLWKWKALAGDVFVTWARLRPVLSMLLPTIAFVIAIIFLGIYVSAFFFITAFMMWQGRYSILRSAVVGAAIPTVMFALFELWFLVPLPKGPLERFLGY